MHITTKRYSLLEKISTLCPDRLILLPGFCLEIFLQFWNRWFYFENNGTCNIKHVDERNKVWKEKKKTSSHDKVHVSSNGKESSVQ